jgi:hypothetical protein
MLDFSDAPEQRGMELIPADTIVPVVIKVRGASADGLKRSNIRTAAQPASTWSWQSPKASLRSATCGRG